MENPSYYSILTASVRYDDRLSGDQKVLFSEITALSNKNGFCHASNEYFARVYKKDKRTIIRWINKLIDYGYVKKEVIYKPNSSEVEIRKLYPVTTPTPSDKTVTTPRDKIDTTPSDKTVTDNITSNNNININTPPLTPPQRKNIKSNSNQINQEEERVNKYKEKLELFQEMNDCSLTPNDQKRFIRKMLQKRDSEVVEVFKQVGMLPDRIADPPAYLYRYLDNLGDDTYGNS